MKNKDIKKRLIEEGYCEEYSQQRFELRKNKKFIEAEDNNNYFHNGNKLTLEEFNALQQLFKARKEQRKKIRKWILYYLNKKYNGENIGIYFGTFSYKDTDKKITPNNLKKSIIRRISPNVIDYIINVDYGRENERLHYHAILIINENNKDNKLINVKRLRKNGKWESGKKLVNNWLLNYEKNIGFYDLEPVKDNEQSFNRLSNYINKLVLHSLKVKQAYISTKKGTQYQKYKTALNSLKKPIKDRTCRENDYINELINGSQIIDNVKHLRDILNYLEIPKQFKTGTYEEVSFYLQDLDRKKLRDKAINKISIFD